MILAGALCVASCSRHSTPPTPIDPYPEGPRLTCPEPVRVTSPTGQATAVVYGAAVATGGAPPVTSSCTPPSESSFPIGSTTVTCTATDARQRAATCTFQVTVAPPPRISVTRFVAFGDSMTVGEDGNNLTVSSFRPLVAVPSPYPTLLRAALASRYTTQTISVSNQGVRGEPLALKSPALPPPAPPRFSQVLASGQYDIALILEGANDLQNRDDRDIPPAIAALQTMVRDAKSRGIKVVLATLPPENPAGRLGLAWSLVAPFNTSLRAMASAENVPVADLYTPFGGATSDFSLLSGDGLHPNQAGYQKIADVFFDVIKQNFEVAQTTITPLGAPIPSTPATLRPPARR